MDAPFFRSIFRPEDEDLSSERRSQVEFYRILSLLGFLLVPLFGVLYEIANPEATDPVWARLTVGILFLVLFGASYLVGTVRRYYVLWMRGAIYVLQTWFVIVAAMNGFVGNYGVGLLLMYAVLAVVVGLGVETLSPLLQFFGYGFALTAGAIAVGPSPETSPLVVLSCLLTTAIVVSLVVEVRLSIREELQEARIKAEEASQLKSAMLANMSHEVRTPLTSITGFAEILKEELENRLEKFAAQIYKSGQRLMRTLDSVLQLSRLEAGVYELEREVVSLNRLVEETAETLRPQAEEKALTLETDLLEAQVEGAWNEATLNRILGNLVENAIKFTPAGGHVEVRVREVDEEAILEVEDTGIGMDPEETEGLFEAFKQESEGFGREYEGAGLGLSIVSQLIEALGGEIEVETKKGEGTCFIVRLPRAGDAQKV